MHTPTISEALDRWRAAERRWGTTHPDDPTFRATSIALVSAWLEYQTAAGRIDPTCAVLVADDEQRYVAAVGEIRSILGYEPDDLLGRHIGEIAAPALAGSTPDRWRRFLDDGRQEGGYRVVDGNGREVAIRFVAAANHPIPGYHLSRVWPMDATPVELEPELEPAFSERGRD